MRKKVFIIFVITACALLGVYLYLRSGSTGTTMTGVQVRLADTTYRVEVADTVPTQIKGLSGHAPLAADEGMLFVFEGARVQSFWMQGMTFPIDIIWIRDGRVEGFVKDAPVSKGLVPAVFSSEVPVNYVLEVPAGSVARTGVKVGDSVEISGYTRE